jgi:hypothetical protein
LRFLLDENIPLRLQHGLLGAGLESEHIITMGRRGLPDTAIVARLAVEGDLVLVTQDTEFESVDVGVGTVIISRVPQSLPVHHRVEIWLGALAAFEADRPAGQLFDLLPTGQIVGWEIRPVNPPA